ncbi:MAG: hypothetical protein IH995_10275 [Proteobacteria bacterium]|nr:hypothetical protein [Pseudomonadota bacterium]
MNNFFSELKRRNVVRVAIAYAVVGWVIMQFVDIIEGPFGLPEWFQKVTIVFLVIGLPIALLLSWAYEVTPEGVKKTEDVDKSKSITHGTGQRINKLIIGGLVLAVGFLLYDKFMLTTGGPLDEDAQGELVSIAVLPFSDLSAARDQEYFGDGMAEEILNILAGVEGLNVTSRTTAFSLKEKGLSIPEMADQLGVSYIVEGSIRSADNRVRITAQLIETETDTHLWSEAYDREMTDIFAIQDDISRSITNALQVELFGEGAIRENPTDNLKAYQLYLQGHHLILQRGVANLRLAVERLRQAVELDPDFALAWADLAVGTLLIPAYTSNEDQQSYLDRADFATDRALELDPDLAMAVAMKGFIAFQEKQWRGVFGPMKRALELEPKNETIWLWYGVQLSTMGYLEEALVANRRAYEIAPATGVNAGWLGIVYSSIGQQEQAHRFVDEAISLGWGYAYSTKAELLIREGNFAGAKQAYHNFLKNFNEPENGLDIFVDALQDPALRPKARAVLGGYLQQRLYLSSLFGGALLGDASVVMEFLETVSNNANAEHIFITAPSYRKVYNDPVFKDYLRKNGLVEFWRENGWPDYCKPVGDDDFECD